MPQNPLTCDDLLFVAFNGRVLALSRHDGSIIWRWSSPHRGQYITLLPNGDMLFVCSQGYTWALNPATGAELWHQPLKGEGVGIPSLATMRATSSSSSAAAQQQADDTAAASAAS
jgi:outer membrane protein assembly factor BamB